MSIPSLNSISAISSFLVRRYFHQSFYCYQLLSRPSILSQNSLSDISSFLVPRYSKRTFYQHQLLSRPSTLSQNSLSAISSFLVRTIRAYIRITFAPFLENRTQTFCYCWLCSFTHNYSSLNCSLVQYITFLVLILLLPYYLGIFSPLTLYNEQLYRPYTDQLSWARKRRQVKLECRKALKSFV